MSANKSLNEIKTWKSVNKQMQKHQSSQKQMQSSNKQIQNNTIITQCVFCNQNINNKKEYFASLLNKALYSKYSSSQNYYYTKEINDILDDEPTKNVMWYYDLECMIEEIEFLKRIYIKGEQIQKLKQLLEYYKYHRDIPRLFMLKVYITINRFHEKKRRLEYAVIKKQLNIQDIPKKKENTKLKINTKHSDEDLSIGQLKYLLKDLKIINETKQQQDEISSTMQLKEIVQAVGDQLNSVSSLSSILTRNESNSFLLRSQDYTKYRLNPNYITNIQSKVSRSQLKQNYSQKTNNIIQNKLQSYQQEQTTNTKNGEKNKKIDFNHSPHRSQQVIKQVQSQIQGFSNFVQKQQQKFMQQKLEKEKQQLSQSQRKISINQNISDYQLRIPSRQSTNKKQSDLLTLQLNFLKTRVDSQLSQNPQNSKSPMKQPLSTDRVQHQQNIKKQTSLNHTTLNNSKVSQKLSQNALNTLKNLQIKNSDVFNKQGTSKGLGLQLPLQQLHYRTKSTDQLFPLKISPPKLSARQENNIQNKEQKSLSKNQNLINQFKRERGETYNINQTNIVNIYIDDIKSRIYGSQTERTKIINEKKTQKSQSPSDCKFTQKLKK